MPPGIDGSLLSSAFMARFPDEPAGARLLSGSAGRAGAIARWWPGARRQLGPASGLRAVRDIGAIPLARALGYTVVPAPDAADTSLALVHAGEPAAWLVVCPWRADAAAAWRDAAHRGGVLTTAWTLIYTGDALRLVETRRPFAPRLLDVCLPVALEDPTAAGIVAAVMSPEALTADAAGRTALDTLVVASDRHDAGVRESLREGVRDALVELMRGWMTRGRARTGVALAACFEDALTVVYRILFLLFAEARALVPVWHPVYRRHYTIDALRRSCERPGVARGLWETLQAISRLAHAGCRAGDLRVTPFNGALFAPHGAALRARRVVADEVVRRTVLALATECRSGHRVRISFRDLGVEQLGSVYESLLDYEPAIEPPGAGAPPRPGAPGRLGTRVALRHGSSARKASGSFYTPRSLTEYLVRVTLEPLVRDRTGDEILALRVVDPAMGSGACLVAACRFLSSALERARIHEGRMAADDITESDRAALRRQVAARCLYGVDLNPTAVQLARLSLWLTTLAADRPLTFLDHHLAAGDSLVGASFDDLARRTRVRPGRRDRAHPALFDLERAGAAVATTLPIRRAIECTPDESVAAVRHKEQQLASLSDSDHAIACWRTALDLRCAAWLSPHLDGRTATDLIAAVTGSGPVLPPHVARPMLEEAARMAASRRFLHWTLVFPEVFFDATGRPRTDAGFDAVLGNPPWDVVRADSGDPAARAAERGRAEEMVRFVRESGTYRWQSQGHPNRYRLFVERSIQLARPGGRIGLVLPSALLSDHSSGELRRALFDRTDVDALTGFDNRRAIFPIHRGIRFLLLTTTMGTRTERFSLRVGLTDPEALDTPMDDSPPVVVERALLARISPEGLAVPELSSATDLRLVERVTSTLPCLSDPAGWRAQFGRELNATEDRALFRTLTTPNAALLPIVGGRQLHPFRVDVAASTLGVRERDAARVLGAPACRRSRVAYRDVAGAGNRLTLIAGLLPAGTVSTHTVFCLKAPLAPDAQLVLLGLLNSFVANYLVRLRVGTHVTTAIVESLRVPYVAAGTPAFDQLRSLTRTLMGTVDAEASPAYAELQALVARLYGLARAEFEHVLRTLPLVEDSVKCAALAAFDAFEEI